ANAYLKYLELSFHSIQNATLNHYEQFLSFLNYELNKSLRLNGQERCVILLKYAHELRHDLSQIEFDVELLQFDVVNNNVKFLLNLILEVYRQLKRAY